MTHSGTGTVTFRASRKQERRNFLFSFLLFGRLTLGRERRAGRKQDVERVKYSGWGFIYVSCIPTPGLCETRQSWEDFLQPRWGRGSRVDVFQQQDRRRGRRRKFPTVAKQHANTQKAPPAALAVALHALTSWRGKSRPSAVGVRITWRSRPSTEMRFWQQERVSCWEFLQL